MLTTSPAEPTTLWAPSVLKRLVEPRYVDDTHGHAMFLRQSDVVAGSGTVLLEERPIAVEQQLMHKELGINACPHCLAFAHSATAERDRIVRLAAASGCGADPCHALEAALDRVIAAADAKIRIRRGVALPFPWFRGEAAGGSSLSVACAVCGNDMKEEDWGGVYRIVPRNAARDGSTISEITSAMIADSERYDERIRMLLRLVAKSVETQLRQIATTAPASCVARGVRRDLEEMASSFAQGDLMALSAAQRAVIRCTAGRLTELVRLACGCGDCESEKPAAAAPAQLIFQLRCVLDANLHTCIVVNPFWSFLSHASKAAAARALLQQSTGHPDADVECGDIDTADIRLINEAFDVVTHEAVHNMGFGLYNLASKFNHSCTPNAAMVPTEAPVRARVVAGLVGGGEASPPIRSGDEVRIAYIRTGVPLAERRDALRHYGFECDCPKCSAEGSEAAAGSGGLP